MAKASRLPADILRLIFLLVPRTTYPQCQLVCRSWSNEAMKRVYHEVHLKNNVQAAAFVRTISTSSRLPGRHVKSLYLRDVFKPEEDVWDENDLLSVVAAHCPNVASIETQPTFPAFWNKIMYDRSNEGYWSHLQFITQPSRNSEVESYVYAALSLKRSLTHLSITDGEDSTNAVLSRLYQKLSKSLPEFKALTNLYIKKHTGGPISKVDTELDAVPRLNDLTLIIVNEIDEPGAAANTTKQSKVKIKSNVENLSVTTNIRSVETLEYITKKFPSLKLLNIRNNLSVNVSVPLKGKKLGKFFKYLAKIPEVNVSNIKLDNPNTALHDVITSGKYTVNIVYPVCVSHMDDASITTANFYKTIDQKKLKISLRYFNFNAELPHESFLEEHGGQLERLKINMEGKMILHQLEPEQTNQAVSGQFLDTVFEKCGALKTLELEACRIISLEGTARKNKSINTLEIKSSYINSNMFRQLSVRLPSLSHLIVFKCEFVSKKGFPSGSLKKFYTIDMPYTSFKRISWVCNPPEMSTTYYVKVCSLAGEHYYRRDGKSLVPTSELYYNTVIPGGQILVLQVKCTSLKEIFVSFCGGLLKLPSQPST